MDYHSRSVEEVVRHFDVLPDKGLKQEEAARRLDQYGLNEIQEADVVSPWTIFFSQFASPIIWLLIAAIVLSVIVGEYVDAVVIGIIVIANAFLGFFQEYKAERAIEALRKMASPHAIVLRDGQVREIQRREVVPGDIIIVETGDKVPADARLIEVHNLQTQEAALTGESTSVSKEINIVDGAAGVADRKDMIFSGTTISGGRAHAVVVGTGMHTEFGKIATMIQQEKQPETPLQKRFARIAKFMSVMGVVIILVTFGLGVLRGEPLFALFLIAVSLAVAAVPEGLPAVVTISLGVGVQRMAKRNALIRRLSSAETLGSVSVICTDKTGTLTHNEMTVQRLFVGGAIVEISGSGYTQEGIFSSDRKLIDVKENVTLQLLLKIGAVNNNAELRAVGENEDSWELVGDPTEGALIVSAAKAGLVRDSLNSLYPRVGEIEFTSERKLMTTIHDHDKGKVAFTKGAADVLLNRCDRIIIKGKVERMTRDLRERVVEQNTQFASEALRVLGFAYREVGGDVALENVEKNMVFVGLQAMIDPPRDEVKASVATCAEAGIRVVMITGDHEKTAEAIARSVGISGQVVTGKELAAMSEEELKGRIEQIGVFARVDPRHKLIIVDALRHKKHIVAMTGDGVNDAPALKKADIGIAMGITGTDVSKEASDMILVDDNFASIVNAVEEGRGVFDNIKKFFAFLLSGNLGEVGVILLAILIGLPLPLTASLILLINLVTDGLPAIALGVDPFEPGAMKEKPRPIDEPVWHGLKGYLIGYPIIMIVVVLGLFWFANNRGSSLMHAQTIVFVSIAFFELYQAFAARSVHVPSVRVGLFKNRWLVGAVGLSTVVVLGIVYVPVLQSLLGTVALSLAELVIVVLLSGTGALYLEIHKFVMSRRAVHD